MAAALHPAEAPAVAPGSALASSAQLAALLHTAALAPLDSMGWIRVSGEDRVRWLNGMVTNSIADLTPGGGCYSFALNAQGRILGDLTAFALDDSILLETSREQVPVLMAHLDHFIIMDDVELADVSGQRSGIVIAGPQALRTVQGLGGAPCSAALPAVKLSMTLSLKQTSYRGAPVHLIQAASPLVPRFEVWADPGTIAQIYAELAPVPQVSPAALEQLRILEGTPRYGVDIRNSETVRDLPQETGQTRALHFSKGCYLGQEIVERIRSRGSVHRSFTGFTLVGTLPAPGAVLEAEGRPVGELTSVAAVSLHDNACEGEKDGRLQLALGYARREALAGHVALRYSGGVARLVALPYAIP